MSILFGYYWLARCQTTDILQHTHINIYTKTQLIAWSFCAYCIQGNIISSPPLPPPPHFLLLFTSLLAHLLVLHSKQHLKLALRSSQMRFVSTPKLSLCHWVCMMEAYFCIQEIAFGDDDFDMQDAVRCFSWSSPITFLHVSHWDVRRRKK